jgi:mRNA-degrading endonuclease RelE of RelBE toxin-antitoxin system
MKVDFSKDFTKALDKLSGKIHHSVVEAINNVIDAQTLDDINNCRKIETLNSVYRLKIGSKRAFFVLHIQIDGDVAKFEYLVSRGEAYDKKNMERLRKKDV